MTTYQTQVYRLRQLFSTLAAITASNPVLLEGEKWQEKDAITGLFTGRTKTGKDGVVTGTAPNQTITGTAFNSLPFDPSSGGGSGTVTSVTGTAPIVVANGTTTPAISINAATTSTPGSMSATDKTKLDSIVVDTASVVRKFVRNNSGVSIPKGSAVYQTSSSGTTLTVALADASAEATAAQTLGLAQETIAHNSNGYVVAVGLLDGVNTSTLTEGQIVWLSETAGGLTTTRPTQPAHGVVCGYCVKQGAGSSGILYVKVDNGLELDELHDVLIPGATTGQLLRKASDGLWKNHTPVAADISDSTTAGRALVIAADAGAQRTALGLGTFATLSASDNLTLSGRFIQSLNGAASAPPMWLTGTWFTGGTGTTTKPQFLIEPAGTTSNSWDMSGTGWGVNGPSGFLGRLADLQLNSVSRFIVHSNGFVSIGSTAQPSRFFVDHNDVNVASYRGVGNAFCEVTNGTGILRFQILSNSSAILSASNHALLLGSNNTIRMQVKASGGFYIDNGNDYELGSTTGTRLGTATTQKLSFWGATPIAQPAAVADATDAASVITQLNLALARLRTIGLIAT